jgi:hypothetical protein
MKECPGKGSIFVFFLSFSMLVFGLGWFIVVQPSVLNFDASFENIVRSLTRGNDNFCNCSVFGHDGEDWASLQQTVRLMDFATGYPLMNKSVLNIGADDSIYFLSRGAIVDTIEANVADVSNLKGASRSIPNRVFHAHKQNLGDFMSSLCFLRHFGVQPKPKGPTNVTCHANYQHPLKQNVAVQQMLHNGLDLLHVKCNGCEYSLLLYLISSGLIKGIKRVNVALHSVHGYKSLRCQLQEALKKTHYQVYCTELWQGWILRRTNMDESAPQSTAASSPPPSTGNPSCLPVVLLLGDSVDRYIVQDFCSLHNGTVEDWSHQTFMYKTKDKASASSLCSLPSRALAHLHLFGSNETGPYRDNIRESWFDPFVDTPARICKGLEIFSRRVAAPSTIVFQVLMWDLLAVRGTPDPATAVARYRERLRARLADVRRCAPPGAEVVIRTVPSSQWGGELMPAFNDALRGLARDAGLRLLDFDALAAGWAAAAGDAEADRFRDGYHPTETYCARFAERTLAAAAEPCGG